MTNREEIVIRQLEQNGIRVSLLERENMGCDLKAYIATHPDMPFLISVASTSFLQTRAYKDYLGRLEHMEIRGNAGLPIVLMLVNENSGSIMLSIILYWKYGRAFINNKPKFRTLNENNVRWLSSCIEGLYNVISFLDDNDLRVVKQIDLNDDRFEDAHVIYLRNFTATYKMKEKNPEIDDFERMLNGTPQNEYPNDILDDVILAMIRKKYPNAEIKSSLHLFGLDIIKMQEQKIYSLANCTIKIVPYYRHPISNHPIYLHENELSIPIDIFYHHRYGQRWAQLEECIIDTKSLVNSGQFSQYIQLAKKTYHQLSQEWM